MFSGIVNRQGALIQIKPSPQNLKIRVRHHGLGRRVRIGDSVAVNGCCLTAVKNQKGIFQFDVLRETWERTAFHASRVLERVNLELPLRWGDPMGGHFVTGHVDATGVIARRRKKNRDIWIEIEPPKKFMRWIVPMGSVALDGVSLTVASVAKHRFSVWLIPHTLKLTTLGWKKEGDRVNLEADMLAKYAQKVSPR